MNSDYWNSRKSLHYYRQARAYARTYSPNGRTLLDVGGGVGMGCRFLDEFPNFDRTSVERCSTIHTLSGVRVIKTDFLKWQIDRWYDIVLCLQVLEHVPSPGRFAEKLFECGQIVIISVPYQWEAGRCRWHLHDPIDELTLYEWTQRKPIEQSIVDQRLVSVFRGGRTRG